MRQLARQNKILKVDANTVCQWSSLLCTRAVAAAAAAARGRLHQEQDLNMRMELCVVFT